MWFGCSFLEELEEILELFTQLCLGRLCKAVHLLDFFVLLAVGPPPWARALRQLPRLPRRKSGPGSKQILNSPDAFVITSSADIQSLGLFTGSMIPLRTILSSLSLTLSFTALGHLRKGASRVSRLDLTPSQLSPLIFLLL